MNSYQLVRDILKDAGRESDLRTVNRLVGNLRAAGLIGDIPESSCAVARQIVTEALERLGEAPSMRTAATVEAKSPSIVESANTDDRFMEIDALIEQGKCPRCKTKMIRVKLSEYNPETKTYDSGQYCKSCRTTLPIRWAK